MFKETTYASQYGCAKEIPNRIVANNAAACANVLNNPGKFPRADFDQVQKDYLFLSLECAVRGITPKL